MDKCSLQSYMEFSGEVLTVTAAEILYNDNANIVKRKREQKFIDDRSDDELETCNGK